MSSSFFASVKTTWDYLCNDSDLEDASTEITEHNFVLQHQHIEFALSLTTDVAVFLIHVKRGALHIDPADGRR